MSSLPPLSLSILGVEPVDEFIREIADFINHTIITRPDVGTDAKVEVEAKIGVLRDRIGGQRLQLPVLVETSARRFYFFMYQASNDLTPCSVLAPDSIDLRFESNMSLVSFRSLIL
jgi:polynucleotide 5'-triphosphatase